MVLPCFVVGCNLAATRTVTDFPINARGDVADLQYCPEHWRTADWADCRRMEFHMERDQ